MGFLWRSHNPTGWAVGSIWKNHDTPGWVMGFLMGKPLTPLVGFPMETAVTLLVVIWVSYGKTHNPPG